MFIYNCYIIATRLLIIVGKDIRSREGTTLGDPTGMATYTIIIRPLPDNLQNVSSSTKHVASAHDLKVVGKLHWIKSWWEVKLMQVKGSKYGYYQKHQNPIS